MNLNRLLLRLFQVFCGFTVAGALFLIFLLGSPMDAFVAGVDLVVHALFVVACVAMFAFGIFGIAWAQKAIGQDLKIVQILKALSLRALLPVGTFALLWVIWGLIYPVVIVHFSSGKERGYTGYTNVYFVEKFANYRLQLTIYEYTVYQNGDYDEFVGLDFDKTLEVRHKGTGAVYLRTFRVGDVRFSGKDDTEIIRHSSDVNRLESNLQKGRVRFTLVTKKGERPWF